MTDGTWLDLPPGQGDRGTYVTWSFTKFLLDTDGKPVRRFEPGAPLTELRLAITDVLRSKHGLSNGMGKGGRGTAVPRWDNRLLQASRRFYPATTEPIGLTTAVGRSDMGPYV